MSADQLITADEMLAMPRHIRRELVRGKVIEIEPCGWEHGTLSANVAGELRAHVRARGLGRVSGAETGFRLASDPDTVRAPDAGFVRAERVAEVVDAAKYFPGPPDLAVEVVSPSDRYTEVQEKAFEWLDAGARAVLVLDPRTQVATVYRSRSNMRSFAENDELDLSDVVDGWRVALPILFE